MLHKALWPKSWDSILFWLPENHFGDHTTLPFPLLVLSAAAARTERLRLGAGSYLLPVRHPLQAAEEVALLDCFSQGRVILGIGRGYQNAMFRGFGVPIKEKRQRFEQILELMIRAWRGEPIPVEDAATRGIIKTATLSPLPVQSPHPPIWVTAFGPKTLAQAERLGLPYIASPVESLNTLKNNLSDYWKALIDTQHSSHQGIPIMRTTFISDKGLRCVR